MGVAEAAKFFGVNAPNFCRDYASDPTFPEPVASLQCGRIWLTLDIEEWVRAHPIRPRSQDDISGGTRGGTRE